MLEYTNLLFSNNFFSQNRILQFVCKKKIRLESVKTVLIKMYKFVKNLHMDFKKIDSNDYNFFLEIYKLSSFRYSTKSVLTCCILEAGPEIVSLKLE